MRGRWLNCPSSDTRCLFWDTAPRRHAPFVQTSRLLLKAAYGSGRAANGEKPPRRKSGADVQGGRKYLSLNEGLD